MKAVLLSIKPKYCELIASGKKTVEVRKTKPNLDVPFKCYIYCTKSKPILGRYLIDNSLKEYPESDFDYYNRDTLFRANSKVIGEFICKSILPISITYSDPNNKIALREFPFTCLTDKEIMDYLGNGKVGYGWCISDLVIYDKPKELSEFYAKCNKFDLDKKEVYEAHCTDCGNEYGIAPCEYINKKWCIPVTKPPQSWCYVESEVTE